MQWYGSENVNEYFQQIEEEGKIPEETVLGEPYYVLTQDMWDEWRWDWERQGEDVSGLDTDGARGSAYPDLIDGHGIVVIDHNRSEPEIMLTGIHEETHIATGSLADKFNVEGVAYARENFYRKQSGLEKAQPYSNPLSAITVNQWTDSYTDAADEIGDEQALQLAAKVLEGYEPSFFEQVKTPLRNPYIKKFDEKVERRQKNRISSS